MVLDELKVNLRISNFWGGGHCLQETRIVVSAASSEACTYLANQIVYLQANCLHNNRGLLLLLFFLNCDNTVSHNLENFNKNFYFA